MVQTTEIPEKKPCANCGSLERTHQNLQWARNPDENIDKGNGEKYPYSLIECIAKCKGYRNPSPPPEKLIPAGNQFRLGLEESDKPKP